MKSICISREFGSGGREIGKIIAQKLGYSFYDSKLVDLAAEKGDIPLKQAQDADEQAINPWLYTPLYSGIYGAASTSDVERMFKLQSEIIKEKASEKNCVFVGRSADAILENTKGLDLLSIYIYAPVEWRIKRLIETEGFDGPREASSAMRKKDKQRRNYYNYYTGKEYADPVNYDLCIDSSFLGIQRTAEFLVQYSNFVYQ